MVYSAPPTSRKGLFPWGSFSVAASSQDNQKQVWNVHPWRPHHVVVWTVLCLTCIVWVSQTGKPHRDCAFEKTVSNS